MAREHMRIPIAVSARHAHLSKQTLAKLFGAGHELHVRNWLAQRGQYAAEETISLIGPKGRLDHVRLMGPPRDEDQIELSRSDELALGIDAPLRLSGDLERTPGITIEGPAGSVAVAGGVITARRHIHMNPDDAKRCGVSHGQTVSVKVDSNGRDLVFGDVAVRVDPDFRLQLHLDTDEANAAGVGNGDYGEIMTADRTSMAGQPINLLQVHDRLQKRRRELLDRSSRVESDLAHRREPLVADSSDQAVQVENDEALRAIGRAAVEELGAIDVALERLARGQYGFCSKCGEAIDAARLTAVPYATLCASCAP